MPGEIEFHFDFMSPYSYLANVAPPQLAREHDAVISYHPFGLVELMNAVGNRPTTLECRNKGAYAMTDLQRWARSYQVKFAPNPHWERIDFRLLGRGALVADDEGRLRDYVDTIFGAIWSDVLDLSERSTLTAALDKAAFNGAELLRRADSPDYSTRLEDNTMAAARRGAFGSPTLFFRGEMFFGNDRLDFLAKALEAAGASGSQLATNSSRR